jgi:hypothetical protein
MPSTATLAVHKVGDMVTAARHVKVEVGSHITDFSGLRPLLMGDGVMAILCGFPVHHSHAVHMLPSAAWPWYNTESVALSIEADAQLSFWNQQDHPDKGLISACGKAYD